MDKLHVGVQKKKKKLKGILHPKKFKFCHHLLTLTCMSFFLLMNTKQDILKNDILTPLTSIVEKNIYYGSQWCQSSNRSSKYLILCSSEERNYLRASK